MSKLAGRAEQAHFTYQDDPRWLLILRIAESPQFRKSAKLKEFLYYVARCTIEGRVEAVNEQQIGCRVFARTPDYNAGEDSIVRVQARLLRKKLEEYFAESGSAEPIAVSIPKGTYVPVFRPMEERVVAVAVGEPVVPVEPVARRGASTPNRAVIAGALLLVLTVVALGIAATYWKSRQQPQQATPSGRAINPALAAMADLQHQTLVVVQDTGLVMLRNGLDREFALEEYRDDEPAAAIPKSGKSADLMRLLDVIQSRQYTSYADVTFTARLFQLHSDLSDRISIRHPKHLHIRDFRANHVILLGGRGANPWNELFEDKLNFRMEAKRFSNRAPQAGEPELYGVYPRDGDPEHTAFAHVAFLPNLDNTGNVLILAGTGMEGTEAAGEFVRRPQLPPEIAAAAASGGRVPYFEVLLRCARLQGAPRQSTVMAVRIYP
jgi:hypothetical protein